MSAKRHLVAKVDASTSTAEDRLTMPFLGGHAPAGMSSDDSCNNPNSPTADNTPGNSDLSGDDGQGGPFPHPAHILTPKEFNLLSDEVSF